MSDADNMHRSQSARQVLEAADRLVAAFGEGRVDDYFACFHPEATFIFYTAEGRVQDLGDTAVFTHDVRTHLSTFSGEETLHERETIVFARQEDGNWLAVHEHLSPAGR